MRPRRKFLAVVALLALALAGCGGTPSPEPSPTPTRTGFATEQAAFAAAEQTLEGYVGASNAIDLTDSATFEPAYGWTTEEEYATQREQLTQMSALGWSTEGDIRIDSFTATQFDPTRQSVTASACFDVSAVRVLDSQGQSVVPPDRPARQSHELLFLRGETPTGLAVARVNRVEGTACDS
jgi:hypothetical protein